MTPKVGDRLADYEIRALIARGGMSSVFRAHDDRLDRDVALKVLSEDLTGDPVFHARFEREWRILAGMRHPNIVPIFDAGEWQGQLYQAMLLVSGADLAQLVALSGPLALPRAVSIAAQVAAALDAAHAQGVLHRDVKPSNVLLQDPAGPERVEHVYLVDFGLTRALDSTRLTMSGNVLGTVGYMAPEVLGGAPADARSDQYGLACVAYQMLAGEAPFRRSTQMGTIMAQLNDPPPSILDRRADLPAGVDQVLTRGMAPAPEDRYPSCAAFAQDLARAAQGFAPAPITLPRTLPAGGPSAAGLAPRPAALPASRAARRRRPSLAMGAAVLAVLVLGAAGALLAERLVAGPEATPAPTAVPSASSAVPASTPPTQPPATLLATPVSALERLMNVIPAGIRGTCAKASSTEPSITGYLVVIQCNVGTSQVLDVRYWLYPDAAAVADEWTRRMAALTAAGLPTADGNCWNGKQGQTAHARGNLQCDVYPSDGTLEVRWTDRRDLVYAAVTGNPEDLKALVQWWSTNAVLDGTQRAAP